jgi:hypothetical protein
MKAGIRLRKKDEALRLLTVKDGWREVCIDLAKKGKLFKIEGVSSVSDRIFCDSICHAYGYKCTADKMALSFVRVR